MRIQGNVRSGELECEIRRKDAGASYLMFTKFKTTLGTKYVVRISLLDNDIAFRLFENIFFNMQNADVFAFLSQPDSGSYCAR